MLASPQYSLISATESPFPRSSRTTNWIAWGRPRCLTRSSQPSRTRFASSLGNAVDVFIIDQGRLVFGHERLLIRMHINHRLTILASHFAALSELGVGDICLASSKFKDKPAPFVRQLLPFRTWARARRLSAKTANHHIRIIATLHFSILSIVANRQTPSVSPPITTEKPVRRSKKSSGARIE